MVKVLTIAMLALAVPSSWGANASLSEAWIAFRYSSTEILFYLGPANDKVGFSGSELASKQLPQPTARWGGGGYLLPLLARHFSALQIQQGQQSLLRNFAPEDRLTVRLGPEETLHATVVRFVEQWGSANPQVQIGLVARIKTEGLTRFQSKQADYFLVYRGERPSIPVALDPQKIVGPHQVLNSLGAFGTLIVSQGDAGWNVVLWRRFSGKLMPTNVAYSYGD